jgi:cation diffusion facilitator family transporter
VNVVAASPAPAPDSIESAHARVRTALFSVLAACFLVAIKLIAGLITGSLGLLAEAAHSGTDLVAALLTLYALRIAVRPADQEHQYGHGKAEHLAALGESAFLALVSVFIAFESVRRLAQAGGHEVSVHWWTLGVLVVVIVIDASRALVSLRVSREYNSAALAANALHFASDLAGSLAVLVGLVLVRSGVQSADSVAALFVAVLVIFAAIRLARDSVDVLMDRAPAESTEAIERALATLEGRAKVRRVRTRQAAGRNFVDLVVGVAPDAGIQQAHATADDIESTVRSALPNTDVLVHVEPLDAEGSLRERASAAALNVPEVREVHNVRVMHVGDGYELSLHAKVQANQTLDAAHATVTRVEESIHEAVPELGRIYTHIEPLARTDWTRKPGPDEVADDRAAIEDAVRHYTGEDPLEILFRDSERGRIAFVTIGLPGAQPLRVSHQRAGLVEHQVRDQRPDLADVVVHTEPRRDPDADADAGADATS